MKPSVQGLQTYILHGNLMTNALHVSNLPPGFDSSMLEDMFTIIGNVRKAQVVLDGATGESGRIGVVEMSTAEETQNAILHFHGQIKQGCALVVREIKRSSLDRAQCSEA